MFNFFYASCNYMVFGMIELLPTTLDFTDGVDVKECSDEADHSVGPVPTSLPIVIGSPSSCDKGLIYSGIEGHTKTEHEDHGTISVDRFGWDVSLGAASGHNITGRGHGNTDQSNDTGEEEESDQVDEECIESSTEKIEEEVNNPEYGSNEAEHEIGHHYSKLSITTTVTFTLRVVDESPEETSEVGEDDNEDEVYTPVSYKG